VRRLVDKRAALRVSASGRDLPEDTAEVDGAELVWEDVGVGVRVGAGAVELK
jgi:hypothetical protein